MLVLPDQRMILGAFIGTVFSMSSVAIIAKVLIDMKFIKKITVVFSRHLGAIT